MRVFNFKATLMNIGQNGSKEPLSPNLLAKVESYLSYDKRLIDRKELHVAFWRTGTIAVTSQENYYFMKGISLTNMQILTLKQKKGGHINRPSSTYIYIEYS
jgi:hypothetical protein